MAKIDWPKAKKKYITGQISQSELAKRIGVSYTVLSHRASSEEWTRLRAEYRAKRAEKAIETAAQSAKKADARDDEIINELLDKLVECVKGMDPFDTAAYRQITIALRDIRELRSGGKDELDIEEQRARIEKLKAEYKRDEKQDIKLEIVGLPEEYKR